ncbi:MAG: hypothetical protein ACOC9V_04420 [Chloroflexota bacterium]
MSARRLGQLSLLLAITVLGVWLLGRPGTLTPEGTIRQQALLQALAPGGSNANQGSADATVGEGVVHDPVAPVTVDLRNVEIHTDETDTMYYQWLQGEIDLDDKESIISEAEIAARQERSRQLDPQPEVQQATSGPSPAAPSQGARFDAIAYSSDSGGSVPPDPELAVGPQHMIAVVNIAVAIYDKSGAALFGPLHAANLFSQPICQSGLYDPNVLYDEKEDRWFIAYDKGPQSSSGGYCVLASRSGDPLGEWNEYFFALNDSSAWLDFPHAGVGDNFIVMGGNMFSGFTFSEGRVFAFRKSDLYAGNSVSVIQRGLSSSHSTPQPLNLHGQSTGTWPSYGNNHYILTDPFNGQTYNLVRWNIASNTLDVVGTVDLGGYGFPLSVPQQGGDDLQANDHRPLDFEYRDGYGWTAMTVACNPGAGTVNCIRYAQINLSDASLGPAGTAVYASNDAHRIFPDLAVNRCGDMVMGYTKSSDDMYPGIWVTGRQADDPYGALQGEIQLKAGEISYHSFESSRPYRWGDYSGMTIDPDGSTFWYLGQYSKNTGLSARWGTYVGSFSFGSCGGSPSFFDRHIYLPLIAHQKPAPTPVEPLQNGDFEQGPTAWTEFSQQGFELIIQDDDAPDGVDARSGTWLAWLGGNANEISVIAQSATVPQEEPTLRFWHWIGSEDDCGFDRGGVVVNHNGNSTTAEVFDLCEATSTNGWQERAVDLSAYAGETVEIELRVETDDSLNSNLFVDDVSLGAVNTLSTVDEPASTTTEHAARNKEDSGLIAVPETATSPRPTVERMWPSTGDSK